MLKEAAMATKRNPNRNRSCTRNLTPTTERDEVWVLYCMCQEVTVVMMQRQYMQQGVRKRDVVVTKWSTCTIHLVVIVRSVGKRAMYWVHHEALSQPSECPRELNKVWTLNTAMKHRASAN
jgi:hypothetical protein